jgi:hypothetical protein
MKLCALWKPTNVIQGILLLGYLDYNRDKPMNAKRQQEPE